MRTFLFMLCMIILSSCGFTKNMTSEGFSFFQPRPLFMKMIDDPSTWGQGWRDGCQSVIGLPGDGALRLNDFKYDINRGIEDKEYYAGFRAGSDTCVHYISPGIN
jgi:hypothetical protein